MSESQSFCLTLATTAEGLTWIIDLKLCFSFVYIPFQYGCHTTYTISTLALLDCTVKLVLGDNCHERPPVLKDRTFLAKGPQISIQLILSPETTYLSWQTIFLWPKGWSFKAGSTVSARLRSCSHCKIHIIGGTYMYMYMQNVPNFHGIPLAV